MIASMRIKRAMVTLALVGAMVACGGDDDETSPPDDTEAEETGDTEADGGEETEDTEADDGEETGDTEADDGEETEDTEADDGSDGDGGCHVDVAGDLTTSWDGADNAAAITTDYWYTEDELKQQLEFFAEEDADVDAEYEQLMADGQAVFSLLLMNCQGPDTAALSFSVSNATTRDDLPMGPGSYTIGGGLLGAGDIPPGTITVLVTMPGEAESGALWGLGGEGTFEISSWDEGAVEGTFSFPAEESLTDTPRTATVDGTFRFTCKASTSCP